MGRLRYPYRQGSRFPARRPDHYTLDPYLVLDIPFHEGSGSLVEDRSIHKNTGTISDGTWKAQGIRGPCLEHDGIDDYTDCGNDASLNVGKGTWEAWVYPTSFTDHDYHLVISKAYFTAWNFGLYEGAGNIQIWVAGVKNWSTGEVSLNEWSHIVATWDGSVIKHYINGQYDSEDAETGSPLSNTATVKIGADFKSGESGDLDYHFTGLIDLNRIYGRNLSAQEVLDRYERTKR